MPSQATIPSIYTGGKTLLARELARLLDAREPQIVNGPEILDKFIGEAEKKVRALFAPAQREYAEVGDDSALHIIVLDEMDAIAKKRGTTSSDTTGVRDSVVNQLLSCMDVSCYVRFCATQRNINTCVL